MKKTHLALLTLGIFAIAGLVAYANIQGDLQQVGITTDMKNIRVDGYILNESRVIEYNTTATARTVRANESGTAFAAVSTSNDPTTFTLPSAAAGLRYTFIDDNATAAADLCIEPHSGDKINNQTAGVSYNATGDAFGETVTLLAVDGTNWIAVSKTGTWTTGN